MVRFMVVGLPRSGTTWASEWLGTPDIRCAHDPLWESHYRDWDARYLAVSCTGIWLWPDWVNAHPARKVVLHRDPREVGASLLRCGVAPWASLDTGRLDAIDGLHVPWTDLFDPEAASRIWASVHPETPFDAGRHAALTRIRMEPQRSATPVDREVQKLLQQELQEMGA